MTEKRKRGESLHAYRWLRAWRLRSFPTGVGTFGRLSSSDSLRMTPRRRWRRQREKEKRPPPFPIGIGICDSDRSRNLRSRLWASGARTDGEMNSPLHGTGGKKQRVPRYARDDKRRQACGGGLGIFAGEFQGFGQCGDFVFEFDLGDARGDGRLGV